LPTASKNPASIASFALPTTSWGLYSSSPPANPKSAPGQSTRAKLRSKPPAPSTATSKKASSVPKSCAGATSSLLAASPPLRRKPRSGSKVRITWYKRATSSSFATAADRISPTMDHELTFRTGLAAALGLIAAAANLIGGYFVVHREWPRRLLQAFLALGAGYMLAVAFLEVIPESIRLSSTPQALLLVLIGFFLVHLFEHTLAPHFHFGEETHSDEVSHAHARNTVLLGFVIHTFFDGVAIAAGFLVSSWLGAAIFFAVFLHKLPEGFTIASFVLAGGKSRGTALLAS